ncbi:MAG: long-chain fatty acid--CoA ligase [Bacteroidales bacterium]|nr:long-chain fatty acid--CoA ligase [Bacteroidales bacterium]
MTIYDGLPLRTFDLLPKLEKEYGKEKPILAEKENGDWRTYSIGEARDIVDAISRSLLALGIQQGDRVAISSRNCPHWNFIDWGIQQVGGVTVPLYTTISENDYRYNLNHAEAKLLFISGQSIYRKIDAIREELPTVQHIVSLKALEGTECFDDFLALGQTVPIERLEEAKARVDRYDLATVIYTSGTTGTPKGVMLTHDNLTSNTKCLDTLFEVKPGCRFFSYLPLSHIFERQVTMAYMNLGATVYYAENMATILSDLNEVKPHVFTTIPRLLEKVHASILLKGKKLKGPKKWIFNWAIQLGYQFNDKHQNSKFYNQKLRLADRLVYRQVREGLGNSLEVIILGGASIQPKISKLLTAMKMPVMEGYGLTETSPVIAVNSPVTGNIKIGSVGFPVENVDVKISDIGEILVKGSTVMKGYYRAPELTAEVIDNEGYFHTGDLGTIDDEGFLCLTGRVKEIFKTSMGKYVSPALVENTMMESPYISSIIVVGEGQKFAGALIIPNFDQLRIWCRENKLSFINNELMVKDKAVITLFRQEVDRLNKNLGDYERVQRFELLPSDWSTGKGEITSTMKIRRNVIQRHYKEQIDRLFDR